MPIKVRGGGQVVSVFAFSNDLSSNPPNAYSFFCKICVWKKENKQKEAGLAHFLKKWPPDVSPP